MLFILETEKSRQAPIVAILAKQKPASGGLTVFLRDHTRLQTSWRCGTFYFLEHKRIFWKAKVSSTEGVLSRIRENQIEKGNCTSKAFMIHQVCSSGDKLPVMFSIQTGNLITNFHYNIPTLVVLRTNSIHFNWSIIRCTSQNIFSRASSLSISPPSSRPCVLLGLTLIREVQTFPVRDDT